MNKIHETIKFTMNHSSPPNEPEEERCKCRIQLSIPFLDVSCSIKNGKIETDLYQKKTDRNMYLLPTSCHPTNVTKNIPFSLCFRIVRICSTHESRESQFQNLKKMLTNRGYSERTINSAIDRARGIPRNVSLRRVLKKKEDQFLP